MYLSARASCLTLCLTLCLTEPVPAVSQALEEEQLVYSRSPSRRLYVNLAVGAVKRLRDAAALKSSAQNGTWLLVPRRQPLADLSNVAGWPYAVPAVLHPHHYMNNVFNFVPHHEFFCGQMAAAGYGTVPAPRLTARARTRAGRGGAAVADGRCAGAGGSVCDGES